MKECKRCVYSNRLNDWCAKLGIKLIINVAEYCEAYWERIEPEERIEHDEAK